MTEDDTREMEYYRAIEDLFAALRGVPHIVSAKDFQLLREWWRDEIPLSAVRAGVTEVFARHRERGETDPVVSLSYCRHAVRKHARRLAEMQIGASQDEAPIPPDSGAALESLTKTLTAAAARLRPERARVAEVVEGIATTVEAAAELPAAALEEHLFALESAFLAACLEALDERDRLSIEERARAEAEATAATPEAGERAFRALRDRLLRNQLGLPRLELER